MKLDALSTLVQGLNRESTRVDKDARDLQTAQVAQQNAVSAGVANRQNEREVEDTVSVSPKPSDADVSAVTDANTRAAAVGADGDADIIKPLVDLLQAATAYKADAAALRVTADVEQAVSDLAGKRSDT